MARQDTADVVIVGGGIMGVSIALHLAEAGAGRVVLFEKRALGAGSSGKSGAILRQHYSHEVTIRMARAGLEYYGAFQERTGRDIGFRRTGMVFVTFESDRAALEHNVALQRSLGVATEIVDAAGLARLESRGRYEEDTLAAWEPEAGFVEPLAAVAAFAEEARAKGVSVRVGETVVEIGAHGVKTAAGDEVHAPVVVNAGGPWARLLLARLGLDYPLRVIRPEQAFFAPPPGFGGDTAVFGDLITGAYWKPEAAGWTRVGQMSYEGDADVDDPDDYDEGVSHAFVDSMRDRIAARLPAFRDAVSWGGCGALYTVTPDAHPLIGEVPGRAGLFLVSGFSGHGFKMAPAVGRGVAALITGGDPAPLDPAFFALDRFVQNRPVATAYEYGILG